MKKSIAIAFITLSGLQIGCTGSQFSASSTTSTTTTTTTDTSAITSATTSTTTTTSSSCSNTVALTGVTVGNLSNYAQTPLSSPNSVAVTVNLYNTGDYHWYGDVAISYYDLNVYHRGNFNAPSGNNVSLNGMYDNGSLTAKYNYWHGTANQFSGFFQDPYGAIVLTVESVDSNLCATGKVYYKNFAPTTAAQSPYRKCWFIYDGPYSCRSDEIIKKSSQVPSGYTYLGSFSGLDTVTAFN